MPKPIESMPHGRLIFAGDQDDPVFRSMIEHLFPDRTDVQVVDWPEGTNPPDILFRAIASNTSASRLAIHRKSIGPRELGVLTQIRTTVADSVAKPFVELIVGDLVRYADLQIAASLVDKITPESIAIELWNVHASSCEHSVNGPVFRRIGILSANDALADALLEIVQEWGYAPTRLGGWSDPSIPSDTLLIWDVPTLSDRWEKRLRDQSKVRPILTLLGFADKSIVERARYAGAVACLGLPFDIEELRKVLDRNVVNSEAQDASGKSPRKNTQSHREFTGSSKNLRKDTGHPILFGYETHLHRNSTACEPEPSDSGSPHAPKSE